MSVHVTESSPSRHGAQRSSKAADLTAASNDLERRREIGQFFTPPRVAGFAWDVLEVIHGRRFSPKARTIDPACGEGVFLRVAAERGKIAPGCLFGADIDDSLPALWHHDSLLKGAHLCVANGLLDLADRGVQAGTFDVVVGNPPFAGQGVRDLLRLLDESDLPSSVPDADLFGTLVLQERPAPAGPPLKPRERAELDQLAKALARFKCWRLTKESQEDGEAETERDAAAGDLFGDQRMKAPARNGSSDFDKAADLVAAWPPNRLLDPTRPETRLLLRRLASTAIEVFFMERFVQLARPGGLIAVIVPESIVASDQLGPLRTWLLTQMQLLSVVSLPQKVFAGVGANAKTSIVFARRRIRPKRAESRLPAAPQADVSDDAEDDGTGPAVLMAAPNPSAPTFSLEEYLAGALQHIRQNAHRLPAVET